MKRAAIYSGSSPAVPSVTAAEARAPGADAPKRGARLRGWLARYERLLLVVLSVALSLALMAGWQARRPPAPTLTQADIDAAVIDALENRSLPSRAAKAAESVRQSVVRVRAWGVADPNAAADAAKGREAVKPKPPADGAKGAAPAKPKPAAEAAAGVAPAEEPPSGEGTGVVIVDDGTILTNLHVVLGAQRLSVVFHDGMESEAEFVGAHPDKDLAIIRAKKIPDDLPPATMGSTANLKPGDEVVVVGFPFGIGPSVSAGVVSGLGRTFTAPGEKRTPLSGLIQFDAAANPGNSGGPLVTMDGEVVGIVTAILNPTPARTFIGIGFATTMESAGAALGVPPF